MRTSEALVEIGGIIRRISTDGHVPPSGISPRLLEWLGSCGDGWTLFSPRSLGRVLGSRTDGIRREDADAVNALVEAERSLRWEIRYFQLLAWLCGMGAVLVAGCAVDALLK